MLPFQLNNIKEKKEDLTNTFNTLLEMGAIPVVNENDSVSYTEIKSTYCLFGDNFMLSVVLKTIPWFWWNSVSESVLKSIDYGFKVQ